MDIRLLNLDLSVFAARGYTAGTIGVITDRVDDKVELD
jgi:hypothetical protein